MVDSMAVKLVSSEVETKGASVAAVKAEWTAYVKVEYKVA